MDIVNILKLVEIGEDDTLYLDEPATSTSKVTSPKIAKHDEENKTVKIDQPSKIK